MDEIKSLFKEFAILSFLQLALAIICVLSGGVIIVGLTILVLYLNLYPAYTIIIGAFIAWFVFLALLAVGVYIDMKVFKRKKQNFINLMNKQLFISVGLKTVNAILRKFHKKTLKAPHEI